MSAAPPAEAVFDVAVVGAGLAGMSAAVFAGNRGLSAVQIGNAGALLFSSGLLDLMGVHPVEDAHVWADPFLAMAAVARDVPGHPYARMTGDFLREAFGELTSALGDAGLPYTAPGERNREVVTGLGTVKGAYCLPRSMYPGVTALAERTPCLLVDFEGLREYSARGIAETLSGRWPGLRALRVAFQASGVAGEAYTAHIARALELADGRQRLVALIRPHLGEARSVGLPAVLGIQRTEVIAAGLSRELGVPVFEIPTMPTSVPGLRLKDALERAVASRRVVRVVHGRVVAVTLDVDGFALRVDGGRPGALPVRARNLVLATGRFMGGGLVADRKRVREPLLDLRVVQPASRAQWHHSDLLDPRGHALNRAGLEVDDSFRPRDASGKTVHPRLFAIGTILAHQDWARMKCGAGVALGSAAAAICAVAAELGPGRRERA
jgi:glycerol-3-phosphate dehydrogenase subunit B